jgi:predicted DNA-binding protein
MASDFLELRLKVPVDLLDKLNTISSANNKTINDIILEILNEKITEMEAEMKKHVVADLLKSYGGKIIKA